MKARKLMLQCLLACCLIGMLLPLSAAANINGAIYTTFGDGTTVNGNLYPSKDVVYLDGGPQNVHGQGLPPGNYYYQITDPSGAVLLSLDDITCRVAHVSDGTDGGVNGRMYGVPTDDAGGKGNPACYHTAGTVNPSNGSLPVQLCSATAQGGCPGALPPGPQLSYYDTPNHGGEYKVWLTPVGDYVGEGG